MKLSPNVPRWAEDFLTEAKLKVDWGNAAFITLSPIAAIVGVIWYLTRHGIHPMEIAVFGVYYWATGIAITAGYHRLYAHRTYKCNRVVEVFYALFGAASCENSILRWARDHRVHHQLVDTDKDPYSIIKGFLWAHMGWIYFKKTSDDEDFSKVPDLTKNTIVMWQERYKLPITIIMAFGIPTFLGLLIGRPFGGFLWGGLLRVVIVHHQTFCINSLAHLWGSRPYNGQASARDSWWLALITYGEGYHNFHHEFAGDYRNGHRWYQFDPGKWWINGLRGLGLVSTVSRYRDEQILRAKIKNDVEQVKRQMARMPEGLAPALERRIHATRERLEASAKRWEDARRQYREIKSSAIAESQRTRARWAASIREHRAELDAALARWRVLIAASTRLADRTPISG